MTSALTKTDLHRSQAYRAYAAYDLLSSGVSLTIWILLTLITVVLYLISVLQANQLIFGMSLISAGFSILGWLFYLFGITYLPTNAALKSKSAQNLLDSCSFASLRLLVPVIDQSNAVAQLLSRVLDCRPGRAFLRRIQTDPENLSSSLTATVLPHITLSDWLQAALPLTHTSPVGVIEPEHLLAALLLHPQAQGLIRAFDLQEDDINFISWWLVSARFYRAQARRWWNPERLLAFSGIGLSWASGFTPLVDRYSRIPRGNLWDDFLVGRTQYVDQLITTLARQRQSNVLLVGQPGVGRIGIVRELARRISASQAHPVLNGQKLVYLHIGELIGLSSTASNQLSVFATVLNEMERAGNIIAVFDGISSVLAQPNGSSLDLTEVLLPFFSSRTVRVVVMLSYDDYHLRLKNNPELLHLFETILIQEPGVNDTLKTLALATPSIETETSVYLPYQSLHTLVEGTADLMPDIPFPERAFDILEEALVQAQSNHQRQILVTDIDNLLSRKTGIPFGQIRSSEAERLLNLEDIMHQRLINQHQAVQAISRALVRARAGIRNPHRPIGTFLFLGPTGVGKTETAKTLADAYFGSDDYVLRFDMSEFQTEEGIAQLIGSHSNPIGRLTSAISDHPFAVLLLDEFEKAHPAVHQLFLQVLDEGHLTDARGHTVSFKHAIIIATSNAGSEMIREEVKDGHVPTDFSRRLTEYILSQAIFRPELLNRFDGVITFVPLTPDHIRAVARLMLAKLNHRLDDRHGVTLDVTDELLDFLVTHGYDPEFGARPMDRLIQNTLEYAIGRRLLQSDLRPGDTLHFSLTELQALLN